MTGPAAIATYHASDVSLLALRGVTDFDKALSHVNDRNLQQLLNDNQDRQNVATYGNIDACTFIPGWFEETMKNCPSPVAAAYIDVDLLLSTRQCLAAIYPRLAPGGSIYSQDGHLPLILELLEDKYFWETELGYTCPFLEGIRKGKLVKITKPPFER
ncbi:TylF/MycF/NovP-related O-methyltransferase [Pantoea sp. PGP6]